MSREDAKRCLLLSAASFFIALLFYRYQVRKPILPPKPLTVVLTGKITSPSYRRGQSQYFTVGNVSVETAPLPLRLYEVRVRGHVAVPVCYGDLVQLRGVLTPHASMNFPELKRVGRGGGAVRGALFHIRADLEQRIAQLVPEPEAGLLSGVLLGSKHALSYRWEQVFKRVGLMHVVVASGYNVSILARVLDALARPLGPSLSAGTSLLGIALFTLMLGAEPPILRAAIMGAISLWGKVLGRPKDAIRALVFSAFLMILYDPLIIDSVSFQLSFAASLGLIILATPLRERFSWKPLRFLGLDEDFFSTVAAFIFIFPIISCYFGNISWAAVLVNSLVLWTIPYMMLFGSLAVMSSFLSRKLSLLLGGVSWIFLRLFNSVALFFSNLPVSFSFRVPNWAALIYYSLLLILCLIFRNFWKEKSEE